jgi:hypothetical protein
MSYCRFGCDRSNVYVFLEDDGLTCCGCCLEPKGQGFDKWGDFWSKTYTGMLEHLEAHKNKGHSVPEYAIERLRAEKAQFEDDPEKSLL